MQSAVCGGCVLKLRALCTGKFCIALLVAWNHKNVCKHSGAVLHPPSAPVWCNHKVIIIQFDVKIMTMLMMMLTGLQRPGTGVVLCQQAACVPEVAILLAWCCCSASYCRQFLMCYFPKRLCWVQAPSRGDPAALLAALLLAVLVLETGGLGAL